MQALLINVNEVDRCMITGGRVFSVQVSAADHGPEVQHCHEGAGRAAGGDPARKRRGREELRQPQSQLHAEICVTPTPLLCKYPPLHSLMGTCTPLFFPSSSPPPLSECACIITGAYEPPEDPPFGRLIGS